MKNKEKKTSLLDKIMYKLPDKVFRNLPNGITVLRGISTAAIIAYLFTAGLTNTLAVGIWTAVTAATDFIDGGLARKYKIESKFGTIADPLVDKSLVFGIGAAGMYLGAIPIWILLVLIRDVSVNLKCVKYLKDNNSKEDIKNKKVTQLDYIPPTIFAKLKMWAQSAGLCAGIIFYNIPSLSLVAPILFGTSLVLAATDMVKVNQIIKEKNEDKELELCNVIDDEFESNDALSKDKKYTKDYEQEHIKVDFNEFLEKNEKENNENILSYQQDISESEINNLYKYHNVYTSVEENNNIVRKRTKE